MNAPPVLTRTQVRRVDQLAVERYGMCGLVLMENAGLGVVDVLLEVDQRPRSVAILTGKGNNAGDGFVIARHLVIRDVSVKVLLTAPVADLQGDARANAEILARADVPMIDLTADRLVDQLDEHAGGAAWLVDALLGTGAMGEPRPPLSAVIAWMNAQAARRLAVDLPSGLDCDTGRSAAATVRADLTATFVAMKPGFLQPHAAPFLGQIHVLSIGVPPQLVRDATTA